MTDGILKMEMALMDGVKVEVVGDRVFFTIDTNVTKRDLWNNQIEIWVNSPDKVDCISSGYLRLTKKNKLEFKKWR